MRGNIWSVYFSPAGGTRQVVNFIAKRIADSVEAKVRELDFTCKENRSCTHEFAKNDIVIMGSPVYAGRIPNKIMPDWKRLFVGNGAAAVAVCTFGNRSYDGALDEFHLILQQSGFRVIAKAAIVCRHVFSEHVGTGRPDATDWADMTGFADKIAASIIKAPDMRLPDDTVLKPYYTPLKADGTPANFLKAKPLTRESCTGCGSCVRVCPMGSIDRGDPCIVTGICIKCQACILKCPVHAKYFDDEDFLSHVKMLEKNYTSRQDSIYIISNDMELTQQ